MSLIYYDKNNREVSSEEFSELFADIGYRRVNYTYIGRYLVSTAWVGLMGIATYAFETMVFDDEKGDFHELDCERYMNEQAAAKGHTCMVYRWAKKVSQEKRDAD